MAFKTGSLVDTRADTLDAVLGAEVGLSPASDGTGKKTS